MKPGAIAARARAAERIKPAGVKTVQIRAGGAINPAPAGPPQPAPPVTNAIPPARAEVAETSNAVVAKADLGKGKADLAKAAAAKPEPVRSEMPPQPAGHGTGNGVLGVLPASSVAPAPSQAMAYADPAKNQPQVIQQNGAIKAVVPAA